MKVLCWVMISISLFARRLSLRIAHQKRFLTQIRSFASSSSSGNREVHVLVPVAHGSEEIETVTIVDTLVRAGVTVTLAAAAPSPLSSTEVVCSRGVKINADTLIEQCEDTNWDMVVIPGGMPGAENLVASASVRRILERQVAAERPLAAICAAPAVVLASLGHLDGKRATCYPAPKFRDILPPVSKEDKYCRSFPYALT